MGNGQGTGRHWMMGLDQLPSLWQDREAVFVAGSNPSSHLASRRNAEKKQLGNMFTKNVVYNIYHFCSKD